MIEINVNSVSSKVEFKDILIGGYFIFNGRLYIKISDGLIGPNKLNVVPLDNDGSYRWSLQGNETVTKVKPIRIDIEI